MKIPRARARSASAGRGVFLAALGLALALGLGARPERPPMGDLRRAATLRESQGYWLLGADGGIFTFGDARFLGPNRNQGRDIAGMARTPDGSGFWTVDDDGDVFHYGTALNYGSRLLDVDDVTGFAARPAGDGYWMASRDGAVFAFGGAGHHGPAAPLRLNRPIVDMAATPSGNGYWMVATDGGIFSFGDARFHGSTGAMVLNRPIVGMAPTPSGNGYWLVASDGGIFAFGDARFHGSTGAMVLNRPIVGMASTGTGNGYWLVASDGGIFTFGDAGFHGSTGAMVLNQPIVAMVATPVHWVSILPVAVPDSAVVEEDSPVVVPVLANDSGLEDGGITVSILEAPGHGSAVAGADGRITYTPHLDYSGPDRLTYRVTDIDGESATAMLNVTVTPRNDPPTARNQSLSTNEDVGLGGSVGASDVDGDRLTYALTGPPAHGTASVTGSGDFTYLPAADFNGADRFTITVSDGRGGTAVAAIDVTVNAIADAPTISAVADTATAEDTPVTVNFTVGDSETPAGSLTLSGTSSNQAVVANSGLTFGGAGANRTVTVTPVLNAVGSTTVTATVSDGSATTAESFILTVNGVDDPPTISAIADRSTAEDTPVTVNLTVGDPETPAASLTLGGTSSNQAVVATSGLTFGGSGANRSLTVNPAANASGSTTITVTVSDGSLSAAEPFLLTVNAVNDPPTISAIADTATDEDVPVVIGFTVGDTETAPGSLTLSGSSSNQAVVANSGITFGGSGTDRTITVTPVLNAFGSTTIAVTVSDGGTSVTESFVLAVAPVNDAPPSISAIADTATDEDVPVVIGFTVGDSETPAGSLTLNGTSSNQAVVANSGITFGGSGANRTITVTPVPNASGSTSIAVTVSDGSATTTESFVLAVAPVNDAPPSISTIADTATDEDTPVTVNFTVGDSETPAGSLTVSGTSSNQAVVATSGLTFGGAGANRTLTVTPAANASGSATITVTVSDISLSAAEPFLLTVNAVNDQPTISAIADRATAEDTPVTVNFTVGDSETPGSLTLNGTSSNQALVANSGITFGGSGANRSLTVTPVPGASGSTTITVTVSDGTTTATASFLLTVNAVNDPPTISTIADTATDEDVPVVIGFTVGDAETAPGSLTVSGSSSNQAVVANGGITFSGSGANRTVTVTPAANASGTTTISVTVSDGGASAAESFVLTVAPVNDAPPTISAIASTVTEEDTPVTVNFTVGDSETPAGSLTVSGTSSNPAVVANSGITFSGTGASRSVTLIPAANASGTTTITVTVSDGSLSGAEAFLLTVNAANDPPTISTIADTATQVNIPVTIDFTVGDTETPAGSLVVTATSSDQAVVADADVVVGGSGANRSITVTPGTPGSTTITVTVSDGAALRTESFVLTVTE
jgi:hypothetical protein